MFKEARLLKRYKRFFADIETPSGVLTIHVPNTGSMLGLLSPGQPCLYTEVNDPARKLKGTLEAVQIDGTWVGVNTSRPNSMAAEAFRNGTLKHWQKYDSLASEVKISDKSRVDLILWDSKDFPKGGRPSLEQITTTKGPRFHFVEIKNTTLARNSVAQFPDAVTERGQKHIEELTHLIELGHTAEILFVVQRDDVETFSPAADIDKKYSHLLRAAQDKGLVVTPAIAKVSPTNIQLTSNILPVI